MEIKFKILPEDAVEMSYIFNEYCTGLNRESVYYKMFQRPMQDTYKKVFSAAIGTPGKPKNVTLSFLQIAFLAVSWNWFRNFRYWEVKQAAMFMRLDKQIPTHVVKQINAFRQIIHPLTGEHVRSSNQLLEGGTK